MKSEEQSLTATSKVKSLFVSDLAENAGKGGEAGAQIIKIAQLLCNIKNERSVRFFEASTFQSHVLL